MHENHDWRAYYGLRFWGRMADGDPQALGDTPGIACGNADVTTIVATRTEKFIRILTRFKRPAIRYKPLPELLHRRQCSAYLTVDYLDEHTDPISYDDPT